MRIRMRTITARANTGVKLYSSAARASFATIICAILRIFTPFLRRIRGAEGDKGLDREDMAGATDVGSGGDGSHHSLIKVYRGLDYSLIKVYICSNYSLIKVYLYEERDL